MQYGEENLSPIGAFFRNKWVRMILVVDVVVVIAVIGILIWQATKVSTINFNIAPIDATISVNGNTNYTNGQYAITPGTYEIKISHEGLETKTLFVDIEPHYVVAVNTFLTGIDGNFDFYELKDNYGSYQKLKSIASVDDNITTDNDASAERFISDFEHRMSILETLPIKGYIYAEPSVNAPTASFAIRNGQNKEDCKMTACLLVKYHGKDYQEAVMEKIKEAGYNPKDYQILYERFK